MPSTRILWDRTKAGARWARLFVAAARAQRSRAVSLERLKALGAAMRRCEAIEWRVYLEAPKHHVGMERN